MLDINALIDELKNINSFLGWGNDNVTKSGCV